MEIKKFTKFSWPLRKYSGPYRVLVLFLAFNSPIVFLLLFRNLERVDFAPLTWLYLASVSLGYYCLAVLFVFSIIFLISFSRPKLAAFAAGAVLTIFVFYLLIDGQTYSLTSLHINLFWLEWLVNDYKGLGLPASTIPYAILALLLVAVLEWGLFKAASRITLPRFFGLSFWAISILALAASQFMHVLTYENNDIRITSLTPHLPAYSPLTSHNAALKYGDFISPEDDEADPAFMEFTGDFNYPLNPISIDSSKKNTLPNIVVIFLESWRFDMMNEQVTPNIYKFSRQATVCTNHFCTGNSTVAGTFGFFYGLDPTYWTAVKSHNAAIDNPVFIDVLKQKGYTFGIFANSNFKRHKIKDTVFRGIDVTEDFGGPADKIQDLEMTDKFNSFLKLQKEIGKPFFGFVFFKSNHAPYYYPPEDSVFLPADNQNLMFTTKDTDPTLYFNDYRNATHYVDRLTGEILGQIESLGLLSNTIVIITTEHGEEFNDNKTNFWGHGSNFTKFQTMVPLIFYAPGKMPEEISYPTSHVDIAPTILNEFLNCTNDITDYSTGSNLFTGQAGPRPFVIGSYVNYAFVIDDNVYEIFPLYTKEYKLDNFDQKASPPSSEMLKIIMEQMGRFFNDDKKPESISAAP
ncbi:MAG TPA: sulfatase-like hydrolase/transferase [candidate division Zixibacteria bacterium]|nr:sulfatase-like hydrolase/transferase [candidate division Zixibacteria bacterium]